MIQVLAKDVLRAEGQLNFLAGKLEIQSNQKQTALHLLDQNEREQAALLLVAASEVSVNLNLKNTQSRLKFIKPKLNVPGVNASQLHNEVKDLFNEFMAELLEIKFIFLNEEKIKFFDQEKLFGDKVFENFPNARDGVKSAGNSMAADLHAAAIYYFMCVVNVGLITLASHLSVRIKKTPLEYAEWQTMLDKIEKKLKQKSIRPAGNKKSQAEARKFYNGLLAEFKFFKDTRNDVMHARSDYKEPEAENAYMRVKDFMERLANGGISETK